MIRFQEVSKRYGRLPGRGGAALRGLDLRVRPGECVALVGPNGAGKSTVVGLALGFLRPSEGRIRVGGLPPRRYVRTRGAGYLPERYSPPARLRVRAALHRLALLDGLGRPKARGRVREALARTGLEDSAGRRVQELSRGDRQRLGVAQLLLCPRGVLLLDEPWGGLDPAGKRRLREALVGLRREHPRTAVLVASHDLGQVARVADRALVLAGGRAVDRLTLGGDGDGRLLERRVLESVGPLPTRSGRREPGGGRAPFRSGAGG